MFILIGILIGFAAAIPLGPVNVFVASQTLKHDFFHGLLAGITTSAMDFVYCLIALVGFFNISINPGPYLPVMKGVATVLLVIIGCRLIKQSGKMEIPAVQEKQVIKPTRPIVGVLALYISNPTLYAFWIAIAGTATAHHIVTNRGWMPIVFAFSCSLGSLFWYLVLVRYVSKHQDKIRPATFQKILVVMGIALIAFGFYTCATIFI
jgi:threonine/homoserine/homoserine lactone efflux protein